MSAKPRPVGGSLCQRREERVVARHGRHRLEEGVPLLPRHRPDLLQPIRGREPIGAARLSVAELEGRVRDDDPVVDGIGEHRREGGLHTGPYVMAVAPRGWSP